MRLRTLGDVRLGGAAQVLAGRRKDLALLAYLARKAPRTVQRAELADLFWEDRHETGAPREATLLGRLESHTRAISATARARLLVARGGGAARAGTHRGGPRGAGTDTGPRADERTQESAAFAAAAAGDFVQAGSRYDSLAADRGIDWDWHVLIELGPYLAARAWERAGDADRARRRYEAFLAEWAGERFDSTLPAVVDARRRLEGF